MKNLIFFLTTSLIALQAFSLTCLAQTEEHYIKDTTRYVPTSLQEPGTGSMADAHRIVMEFGRKNLDKVNMNNKGIPTSITGDLSAGITATEPVEKAYQYFELHKDLYQINDPRKELKLKWVHDYTGSTGGAHVAFNQVYNGIGVGVGDMRVHLNKEGKIWDVTFKYDPEARKVDTTPSISEEQAKQIAVSNPDYEYNNPYFGEPELLIAHFEDGYHLVWRFYLGEITDPYHDYGGKFPTKNDFYYLIDAKTGQILKLEPGIIY
jgi:Zn-dependent metalloprotease